MRHLTALISIKREAVCSERLRVRTHIPNIQRRQRRSYDIYSYKSFHMIVVYVKKSQDTVSATDRASYSWHCARNPIQTICHGNEQPQNEMHYLIGKFSKSSHLILIRSSSCGNNANSTRQCVSTQASIYIYNI